MCVSSFWTECRHQQFKFDETQNNYLTQTLVFLAGAELKKINFCLRRLNKVIYVKRIENNQSTSKNHANENF